MVYGAGIQTTTGKPLMHRPSYGYSVSIMIIAFTSGDRLWMERYTS